MAIHNGYISADNIEVIFTEKDNHPIFHCTIKGTPPTQARHCATTVNGTLRFFDPTARSKRAFKRALKAELGELGFENFPVFPDGTRIKLDCLFGCTNLLKDVDNLVKYLMDALQDVMYTNDNQVFDEHGKKRGVALPDEFSYFTVQEDE